MGLKCFWEFTQAITLSINLMLKCFTAASAKGSVKENAKVISLWKNKLERVKMQKLNGAILLKHINTVKTNSYWHAPPLRDASFIAWSCIFLILADCLQKQWNGGMHSQIFTVDLQWSFITETSVMSLWFWS